MSIAVVTLKNGATVADVAVTPIMLNLELCQQADPIAFYELVCICRDPAHVPFGDTGAKLRARGLLEANGRPHDTVRDVVLSAITGNDLDMQLSSPVQI